MKKLTRLLIAFMVAGVAACVTDDPRGTLKGPFLDEFANPSGRGELCGEGWNPCASGFTCYDEREPYPDYCLDDAFAAACDKDVCGSGFCAARGTTTVATFCNCDSGNVWNGQTCIADTYPTWAGSITSTTCPAEEIAPGVPDETTANCPANSFCDGSGNCLEQYVELDGNIGGTAFADIVTLGDVLTDAECQREYYSDGEGLSNGYVVTITGTLADTLIPGATEIEFDVSENDAVGGGSFIVWPQTGAPGPAGDAGYVDFSVTGALGNFDDSGIGGFWLTGSVSGDDDDEDGLLDNGTGAIGAVFFVGFGGTDYVSGAFTVDCGTNIDLGTVPTE